LLRVGGAHWDTEMGALTHMLTEKSGGTAPAILFDEVPGYPKSFRTLYGHFSSIRRVALTLGLPLEYERKVERQGRADPAERDRGRRLRRAQVSRTAPPRSGPGALHRHRRLRDHPGSRRRMVQSGRVPLPGLRRQDHRLPDHRGQARPHPSRQVLRARPVHEGGDSLRPGSAALHARGHPDA
ncbi:MAG: UbiD family decarboxylase, partial [Betaproteobacteria bacterium]